MEDMKMLDVSNGQWWNYVTGNFSDEQPTTDEVAVQYIPQDVSSQGMYKAFRNLGLPILKALANVLHANAGQEMPFKA